MNVNFQETILRAKFSKDKVFEVEASEAYWTLREMIDAVKKDFDDIAKQDRALLESIRAWVEAKAGFEISVGQAEAVEIAIYSTYEEHKKKLPDLPTSLATTSSTLQESIPPSTARSTTTSTDSTPKTKSPPVSVTETLAQHASTNSSDDPPET